MVGIGSTLAVGVLPKTCLGGKGRAASCSGIRTHPAAGLGLVLQRGWGSCRSHIGPRLLSLSRHKTPPIN